MAAAEALRDQILDGLADKFRLCVTKQFRRARIRATDITAFGVRDKDRVGRNIKQIL